MTPQSQKILDGMQVRKTKKQKAEFRAWLCSELEAAGYAPTVEKSFLAHNVVVGGPEQAQVLFTAHYDTQPVLPIPNFITPHNSFFYLLYQMAFVIPLFALAFGASFGAKRLFDLPGWAVKFPALAVCAFVIWWFMCGKANQHTANDNTSGVITLVETALALPPEARRKVCFVFFDNEEKGLFGSFAFANRHKQVKKNTLVINFDCVAEGDFIHLFPHKRVKKDAAVLERLEAAFLPRDGKEVQVVRGSGFYPSDNANFKRSVGVCALKYKKGIGYYMDHIHTSKDTVFQEENITLLQEGCLRLAETLANDPV